MRPFCAGFCPLLAGNNLLQIQMGHFIPALKNLDVHVTATFISSFISAIRLWFHICWWLLHLNWISSILSSREFPSPNSQKFAFFHLPVFKTLAKVSHKVSAFFFLEQRNLSRSYGTWALLIWNDPRSYIIWWIRNTISQSHDKRMNLYIATKVTTWRGKNRFWRYRDMVWSWWLWLSFFQHRMADTYALS